MTISTLKAHAYTRRAPVVVQSFEVANLKALRKGLGKPSNVTLAQLVMAGGPYDKAQPADIVAPNTRAVIPLGQGERLAAPAPLVADAHKAGLAVAVWTFRPEDAFLAADFRSGAGPNARNDAGSIAEIRC